jgi:hypothetical protein
VCVLPHLLQCTLVAGPCTPHFMHRHLKLSIPAQDASHTCQCEHNCPVYISPGGNQHGAELTQEGCANIRISTTVQQTLAQTASSTGLN